MNLGRAALISWLYALFACSYTLCSHAQSVAFEGVSLQSAVGIQPQTVKVTGLGINNTPFTLPDQRYNTTAVPFYLGATYTASITPEITLGGVLEYAPVSKQVSLSLAPGYAITEGALGYLKLGWVYTQTNVDQGVGRSTIPGYMNGGLLGAGVRVFWTNNIYAYAEFNYIKFASLNFGSWYAGAPITGYANTDAYNVMVGFGYKF